MLFDRICHDNGIKHLLTAPYSPTTTGKIERFHRTVRDEFLCDHDRVHATIAEAQAALDIWVAEYNTTRNHQSLGDRPPIERFELARSRVASDVVDVDEDARRRGRSATSARRHALGQREGADLGRRLPLSRRRHVCR